MNRSLRLLALLSALAFTLDASAVAASAHRSSHARRLLLSFGTMFGVDGAFVGSTNPVDDIPGDELPWEIARTFGTLDTDGNLFVIVRGLVFKDDPSVPEELRGINDEDEFRAAVSCLTEANDAVSRSNVVSDGFPANLRGNSLIFAHLELPDPCIAPAVFILAGSEDKWFAVTGFETEEE